MEYQTIAFVLLGHLVTDISQGALPALLPFLIVAYHLSYTAAAFIIFAANIASSIVQPVFGYLADRFSIPWLMPVGVLLAGTGLAAIGLVSHYPWLLVAAMVSGFGAAAFHPQGARLVNRAAGEKKGTAMSIFGVGGTLGFALGPVLVTAAVLHWGLKGAAIFALPAVGTAGLLAWYWSTHIEAASAPRPEKAGDPIETGGDAWGPFARLTGVVITRAVLFYGFNTFVPLYWIHVLRQSQAAGAMALTCFSLAGILGNLLGGFAADRFGHVRIAAGGFVLLLPLIPAFLALTSEPAALAILVLIGFALSTTYSPLIILGQRYLPNRIGFSAGVTLGLGVTIGGVTTPLLGQVADHHGLWAALAVLSLVPLVSAGLTLTLPRPVHMYRRQATQADVVRR
jgi:FSR family fosmidomycin resistance protein-like MFS transporter